MQNDKNNTAVLQQLKSRFI